MICRRTPEEVAAADHVRRSKVRGPEAVARAKQLKAEAKAAARKTP